MKGSQEYSEVLELANYYWWFIKDFIMIWWKKLEIELDKKAEKGT